MTEVAEPHIIRAIPPAIWLAAAGVLVALAIMLHPLLPRYDFRMLEDGRAIVIYDRWTGMFQRVNYDTNGEPGLTRVVRPF